MTAGNGKVSGRVLLHDRGEDEIMRIVRMILIIVSAISLGIFGVSEIIQAAGRDRTIPEITSTTDVLEIPCDYTEEQLLEGLSASDGKDGDLTSRIIPGAFSRFIEKGLCNLTYVVFDSSNQPASLTRQVRFTDYHSPRFTLTEPLVFVQQEGSYSDAIARLGAQDMLDGDLSGWITQTDTDVNYQQPGSYTMTVEVSNSFGDTSTAALPVHVVSAEQLGAEISLVSPVVYVSVGATIDPASYVSGATDTMGNEISTDQVSASSGVDTQTPGCYEIHYEVYDDAGSSVGQTWLTVIVEE